MILKALYDYYHRCGNLPQKGLELKEIGYLIVIEPNGSFLRIESRMLDKKHAQQFLVPQTVLRSGRKYVGNYLWDNCEYVTGYSNKNQDKAVLCNKAFIKRVEELKSKIPQSILVSAVFNFYNKYPSAHDVLKDDAMWKEMSSSTKNVSFLLQGAVSIAAMDDDVIRLSKDNTESSDVRSCLVTGIKGKIARVHAKVPLQGNAFSSLVSFKDGKGYDSYGKEQGANAPISEETVFAYTTALNHLLASDSRNKFTLGDRTFLFWASKNDEACQQAEYNFYSLFGFDEQKDDPNKNIEQVRKVFKAIYKGTVKTTYEDTFYVLGLALNASRIAVTYWAEIPLRKFAGAICKHFDDMDIIGTHAKKKPYASLLSIISSVTLDGKVSDAVPNLADTVIKSVFEGLPYPHTLFLSCIRRIRAESENKKWDEAIKRGWFLTRAAIIKAYLNRTDKNYKTTKEMNKDNTNPGYLCGRLFAVLERIQEISNRENDYFTNLRSNYMNTASTTPSVVFPTILNLSVHHSDKLDRKDGILFEKDKQEIIGKLVDFPNQLSLQDQGRFFIGYYHQRQNFFAKSEENNNE
jgi:CRISPR-associated protein Csd1